MPQVFCIHSASFKLDVAYFTEKSPVEVPLIYTRSIGKMVSCIMSSTGKSSYFAFRVTTNGEAVDITNNIVEQHVGEFMQLIPLAKN